MLGLNGIADEFWKVAICGAGVFLSMALVNWATTTQGTAAAFGVYVCSTLLLK